MFLEHKQIDSQPALTWLLFTKTFAIEFDLFERALKSNYLI
jgi:hypothetical protein